MQQIKRKVDYFGWLVLGKKGNLGRRSKLFGQFQFPNRRQR